MTPLLQFAVSLALAAAPQRSQGPRAPSGPRPVMLPASAVAPQRLDLSALPAAAETAEARPETPLFAEPAEDLRPQAEAGPADAVKPHDRSVTRLAEAGPAVARALEAAKLLFSSRDAVEEASLGNSVAARRAVELYEATRGPLAASERRQLDAMLSAQPLRDDARALLKRHELSVAAARGERLYRAYFPALYRRVPVKYRVAVGAGSRPEFSTDGREHVIALGFDELPLASRQTEEVRGLIAGGLLPRRVAVLIAQVHEYAHALFETGAGPRTKPGTLDHSAYDAMTEGFAVTIELAVIGKMTAEPARWGLSEADVAALKKRRAQRLRHLLVAGRMAREEGVYDRYVEGTLRYWHKIYKAGGEAALLRSLSRLNADAMLALPLDHPLFAVINGNPPLMEELLGSPERLAPAMEGLAAVAAGRTPTLAGGRAAYAVVGLADLRPLMRSALQHRGLTDEEAEAEPLKALDLAIRLATTYPDAGRALAEEATDAMSQLRYRYRLWSRPAWAAAVLDAVVFSGLTDAEREQWRAYVAKYAANPPEKLLNDQFRKSREAAESRLPFFGAK